MPLDEHATELNYARMVDNAKTMSIALQPIFDRHNLRLKLEIFPSETHNSVPWVAVNPILEFALAG